MEASSRRRMIVGGLLWLLLLVLGVFWNALGNGFHLDDGVRIKNNPEIRTVRPLSRHFLDAHTMSVEPELISYRPLLPLTLSLNVALTGLEPAGLRLGNLLVHGLSAMLFFLLALRWAGRESPHGFRVALLAASLFAVHPVSGVPVNYLCARDLQLMTLFVLAALLVHARSESTSLTTPGFALVLACYLLALCGKENAVLLVPLVWLHDVTLAGRPPFDRRTLARPLALLAATALFLLFVARVPHFEARTVWVQGSPLAYLLRQLEVHVFHYLRSFVWPFDLCLFMGLDLHRVDPLRSLLGALVLGGGVTLAWTQRARAPLVSFGFLAYLAALIPTSSLVPISHVAQPYRPYPGSPFLFLALSALLFRALSGRRATVVATLLGLYLAGASVWMNRTYRDDLTMWSQSFHHGRSGRALVVLAQMISDPALRVGILRQAPDRTWDPTALRELAVILLQAGECEVAEEVLQDSIAASPDHQSLSAWYGLTLRCLGREDEARRWLDAAGRPDALELAEFQAAALEALEQGHRQVARVLVEEILRHSPGDFLGRVLKGKLALADGQEEAAILALREAARGEPPAPPHEHWPVRNLAPAELLASTRLLLARLLARRGACEEVTALLRQLPPRLLSNPTAIEASACREDAGEASRAPR